MLATRGLLPAVRRAAFVWQFAAAVVLPLWLLVGFAIRGAGVGGLLGVSLLAPLVVIGLLGFAALLTARATVRRSRMLGSADTAVLVLITAALVGVGVFGPATTWFGVLAVAAVLGGWWLAGWELVTDVRARMRQTLAAFGIGPRAAQSDRTPIDAGEYVVITPSDR